MRQGVAVVVALAVVATAAVLVAMTRDTPRPAAPQRAAGASDASVEGAGSGAASPRPAGDTGGSLVVWGRGELTRAFRDAVAALPGVVAASHVRSGTLGIVGPCGADGTPVDQLADGFRIPVEVVAVDPGEYAATLPQGRAADALGTLTPGSALLSETGARLRRIGVGGQIDLAGLAGLRVVAIVADDTVGRSEIVIHAADAGTAGLDHDGTVHIRHEVPAADQRELEERIEALVPDDVTARVVDVRAAGERRRAPLVLSLAQVKDRFGEFAIRPRRGQREVDVEPGFAAAHIVTVDVPILGSVTCHRLIIDDLRGALDQIIDAGLAAQVDPSRYAGCYYPRRISASRGSLSHHSWGIALDINVDLSLPGLGPPPHPRVVEAFEAHGFRWGGDFITPDNHHFEWVGGAA